MAGGLVVWGWRRSVGGMDEIAAGGGAKARGMYMSFAP